LGQTTQPLITFGSERNASLPSALVPVRVRLSRVIDSANGNEVISGPPRCSMAPRCRARVGGVRASAGTPGRDAGLGCAERVGGARTGHSRRWAPVRVGWWSWLVFLLSG